MNLYYIARPGRERQGPFPEATIRANLKHPGFYAADTLAWCKGMDEWQPLAKVFGGAPNLAPVPAPKPAPTAAPAIKTALPAAQLPHTPKPAPVPKIYYVAERGGERQGPVDLVTLMAMKVTPNTVVWKKGMPAWAPIASVLAAAGATPAQEEAPPLSFLTVLSFLFPIPFESRIGVRRFFCAVLAIFLLACILTQLIAAIPCGSAYNDLREMLGLALFLSVTLALAMQVVCRLHDSGLSSWYLLLNLLPLIGWFVCFILCLYPGDKGKNKYGQRRPMPL